MHLFNFKSNDVKKQEFMSVFEVVEKRNNSNFETSNEQTKNTKTPTSLENK